MLDHTCCVLSANMRRASSKAICCEGIARLGREADSEIQAANQVINKLWQQAQQADDVAARHQQAITLIGLAAAAAGLINSGVNCPLQPVGLSLMSA
jgi:hypothetical protein